MTGERRCPNCGALVVGDAGWCGQCYAPLGTAARTEAAEVEPAAALDEALRVDPGGAERAELDATGVAAESADTRVSIRRIGEALLWSCPQCDLDNPMEASVCGRCQTPFSSLLVDEQAARQSLPAPNAILMSALLLPGLGHVRLGRAAEGIARLILFLWAAGLGLMMLLSLGGSEPDASSLVTTPAPRSGSPGAIVAVGALFVASGIAIWGLSAMDAVRLARGDDEQILKPRVLLVGTIVLTLLSIGAFIAAGISSAPAP